MTPLRRWLRGASPLLTLFIAAYAHAALHTVGLNKNNFTSDFMIGNVVVAIVFPESNGAYDPNTETWSDDRKALVISEIIAGHDWWIRQNPDNPLSFTYVTQTVPTKYEPITRPYYQESLWIPDIMSQLGYNGNRFQSVRSYVNDLRETHNADWGFVIFVVDSGNDTNGKLADGFFAYAYLGGPFMVMTYDNGGYGISNMDVVAAHETGHIFHALDQYAGASSPYDYSYGYFPTINGNHAWSQVANDPNSIMRGGLRWGLDAWAKKMIGWRDDDANGRADIIDQTPAIQLASQISTDGQGTSQMTGNARVTVLPRQANAYGHGFTLDTITGVEYRFGEDEWQEAQATDGDFDGAEESFIIAFPSSMQTLSTTAQDMDIELRAVTAYSQAAGNGGGGGGVTINSVGTLNSAHAFPNPFKPNSQLGHTDIKFTGLTPGAKIQIFTEAGEPVYEATADSSANPVLPWTAIDEDGTTVASGVYMYLITDPAGNKKKGKLAILR